MRSSKSRSRNKSNRQRSLVNIVNRVFDSSGPEGKVRGTPQQIIEKYLTLARDAQLSNDRVAEQSFLQHAEHYTRLLGEAQREQAERQHHHGGSPREDDRDEMTGAANGGHGDGHGAQNGQNGQNARADRDDRRDERRDER
jgi:ribosomal protein L17